MLITTVFLQSFVLAQVFGMYLLIMTLVLFTRADYYRSLVQEIQTPGVAIMLHASLSLFIGFFLVIIHNIWVLEPRVLVTVLCWLFLIKAIAWLVAPVHMLTLAKRVCAGKGYYVAIGLMALLAFIMMTRAFYLYVHYAGVMPVS
jgi:hypothetical protein